jgi:hypothetical protein
MKRTELTSSIERQLQNVKILIDESASIYS